MLMLGNVFVVVIGDSKVQKNIEYHRKTEQGEIQSIAFMAHDVLHGAVNSKYPERFDQNIQKKEQQ